MWIRAQINIFFGDKYVREEADTTPPSYPQRVGEYS